MKQFLIAVAFAASLALGGCATTGGGGSAPDNVQQLISAVAKQCPFVLAAGTAVQLISAASGQGAIAITVGQINQLAAEVCAAISPKSASKQLRGGGQPVVRGVVIQGTPIS